ncbi:RNA-binding protein [Modicisalibacter ilicicola DSM 19980]|uniref:RNA-binding protein n=1 Tax=Modicisalibacter ilicicola DSM 19980 TaxID=1121942 RepID=A0A1M5AKR7_9GAMM|nr:ribosome assembly RNA-binding protein YhbY [Halomonas ilicicola]SHF30746.1 RNA-binding protein [Halomonas ilicicola DSM 19980]
MSLSQAQKKAFRSIGHHLDPVVTIADSGLTENVIAELERALNDHELVKIKLALGEREQRRELVDELARDTRAEVVQVIGKMALLYRHNPRANPRLSNIARAKEHHGRH